MKTSFSWLAASAALVDAATALREQHPFFCKVFNEGIILYKAESKEFEFQNTSNNSLIGNAIPPDDIERAFELADRFMSMASDAIGNEIFDGRVFLLHQAMEQMCIASIKAHLHYRPTTHNIEKLVLLVHCYVPEAKDFFPCNTSDERELFDFLRKAYSDVRYKSGYRIPAHIAFSLLEHVEEFSHLLTEKYQELSKISDSNHA